VIAAHLLAAEVLHVVLVVALLDLRVVLDEAALLLALLELLVLVLVVLDLLLLLSLVLEFLALLAEPVPLEDSRPNILVDVERHVAVRFRLEPGQELGLDRALELGRRERLGLAHALAPVELLLHADERRPAGSGARVSQCREEEPLTARRDTYCWVLASLRILIRYCVILVIRCLHLCTVKLGQYWSSASIWSAEQQKADGEEDGTAVSS
jgi:hypothetical protein